jgi:regulator of cell morphogenesis and NO signaling
MPQAFEGEIGVPAVVEAFLKRHAFLRKELAKAGDLAGRVIIEQRPPLCRTLLPLYRLFQELREDLEEYLELQEKSFIPLLVEIESGSRRATRPARATDGILETMRLLKHGQATLTSVLDEMGELTQGFLAPINACACYEALLESLAAIHGELLLLFRLESSLLFPRTAELAQQG